MKGNSTISRFCTDEWGEEIPLKPCPFCGGKAARMIKTDLFNWTGDWSRSKPQYRVYCAGCGISTDWKDAAYQAEDRWNKRVPPDVSEVMDVIKAKVGELR